MDHQRIEGASEAETRCLFERREGSSKGATENDKETDIM